MIYGYYELGGRYWCQVDCLGTVCDMLSEKFPNDFKVFDNTPLREFQNETKNKYGPWNLVLENPENGKFFFISYMDFLDYIKDTRTFFGGKHGIGDDLSKCVEIFATTGLNKDRDFYEPTDIIATPISNTCATWGAAIAVENCYKKTDVEKIIHDKPTFYGYLYGLRYYLSYDNRFDVRPAHMGVKEYIEDLHKQKICFGLGGGEISPRDIEIMGLGNALFRPKFRTTRTHNPLIPNYHYISVEHEDIPMIPGHIGVENYFKEVSDRIIERYNEVKKDDDFIKFIGENGRAWYEENGTVKKAAEIIYNLLDFSKLI